MKSDKTTYSGRRLNPEDKTVSDIVVIVEDGTLLALADKRLSPKASQKVYNHSPDGFSWGFGGSGPAQLALAIMLDFLSGDKELALACYQDFKWKFVAGWEDSWHITGKEIREWYVDWFNKESVRISFDNLE